MPVAAWPQKWQRMRECERPTTKPLGWEADAHTKERTDGGGQVDGLLRARQRLHHKRAHQGGHGHDRRHLRRAVEGPHDARRVSAVAAHGQGRVRPRHERAVRHLEQRAVVARQSAGAAGAAGAGHVDAQRARHSQQQQSAERRSTHCGGVGCGNGDGTSRRKSRVNKAASLSLHQPAEPRAQRRGERTD